MKRFSALFAVIGAGFAGDYRTVEAAENELFR